MTLRCSVRNAGVGNSIRINRPAFEVSHISGQTPLRREIELGQKIVDRFLTEGQMVDLLLVVSSLPKTHRALTAATLVRSFNLSVTGVMELGGHCGSILDALHYLFCSTTKDQSSLIVSLDSFASSYKAISNGERWSDGAGGIYTHINGPIELKLLAYAVGFDTQLLEIAHDFGEELSIPFRPKKIQSFEQSDEQAIFQVASLAAMNCGMVFNDFDAVVTVNRSTAATARVEQTIGKKLRDISRNTNSHMGCTDLIANLGSALDRLRTGRVCILGFGLGYAWHAMILECKSA